MRAAAILLLLLAPALAPAEGPDDDFDAEVRTPSLALGPAGPGGLVFGLDVGWLRSGLQAHLGMTSWLDLMLRAEAMALVDGLGAQNSLVLGVRLAPETEAFRYALELSGGRVMISPGTGTAWVTEARVNALAGLAIDRFLPYARLGGHGLDSGSAVAGRWAWDAEAGLGVESAWLSRRQLILAAEAFSWVRSGSEPMLQWRLRVGWSN